MTTVNRQIQDTIVKFHTTQALKDWGIEVEVSKKKTTNEYKPCYSIQ